MSKVLLSSGGMDSFLLAHEPELAGAVHVFVDIGQAYASKEAEAARYVANSVQATLHHVVAANLCTFEHKPTGIIPFRNAELILCAAQYGDDVYLGVIADEVNSDKSEEFLFAMTRVLDISHRGQYWTEGRKFQLLTPFRNVTKTQMVTRYLSLGGSLKHLLHSVSCYSGSATHCGRCSSCFKRWVALTGATGTDFGAEFNEHPATWRPREHWVDKLRGYPLSRQRETLDALDIAGV